MWKKIALAAALCAASVSFANAQGFDPNPANRGFPAYADPNPPAYHMGVPQGGAASAAAPSAVSPGHESRPAALLQGNGTRKGRDQSPRAAARPHSQPQ
jgi:hypothetical protein